MDDAARGIDQQAHLVDQSVFAHFLEAAALGAHARHEEEAARSQTAHIADELAAGGTDDKHHVDGRAPLLGLDHHIFKHSHTLGVADHLEVLRALVGCEGQHHCPLALEAEEGSHAVLAHVGSHRDGIDTGTLEEGLGIHAGGVADVAALCVGDDELVGILLADIFHGFLKHAHALGAHSLVEGEVGLVGHAVALGGVDDCLVEFEDAFCALVGQSLGHLGRIGIEPHAQEAALAQDIVH